MQGAFTGTGNPLSSSICGSSSLSVRLEVKKEFLQIRAGAVMSFISSLDSGGVWNLHIDGFVGCSFSSVIDRDSFFKPTDDKFNVSLEMNILQL